MDNNDETHSIISKENQKSWLSFWDTVALRLFESDILFMQVFKRFIHILLEPL